MMLFIPCQISQDRRRCTVHGGPVQRGMCLTGIVLEHVAEERQRQFARYGTNESLADGTGPDVEWIWPIASVGEEILLDGTGVGQRPAEYIESAMRLGYEEYEREHGAPTWMHLVREEIAEAFQEDDPQRLADELIQVAALCVSWVEKLVSRKMAQGGTN